MSRRQEIEDTGETETEERLVFLLKKRNGYSSFKTVAYNWSGAALVYT